MPILEPIIREVRQDEDFDRMRNLITENGKFTSLSTAQVRDWFFPKMESQKQTRIGYLSEVGSKLIAYMLLDLRDRDGVMTYAIQQSDSDNIRILSELLETCANVIIERGGKHLHYFAFTEFGQLRNREIFMLERLGFRTTDEYMRISTRLSLLDWDVPEGIHTEAIIVEKLDFEEIYQILLDDGNFPNAVIFKHQFNMYAPSNVFLTLRDHQQNITALAYYKVKKVDPNHDVLSATAFSLHFRQQFALSRNEKKQFLQGVLCSMKQLDLLSVNSLMSLKNVDIFTLMVREGFDEIRSNFFALTKTVGER